MKLCNILKNHKSLTFSILAVFLISAVAGIISFTPTVRALPSYTISQSGSLTVVSDSFSSTNANLAFTHAFGLVSSGGTLIVNAGTYIANGSSIIMSNCIGVNLAFQAGSLLTITNNVNNSQIIDNNVFLMQSDTNCIVQGIDINGNAQNQNKINLLCGIYLLDCNNCTITGGIITNCRMIGTVITNTAPGFIPSCIENCVISYCGWNCVQLGQYAVGSAAINNTCSFSSDVGISSYTTCTIQNNNVYNITGYIGGFAGVGSGSHYGIAVEADGGNDGQTGMDNWIIGNTVTNCTNGIDLGTGNPVNSNYCAYNTISNCTDGIVTDLSTADVITQNEISNWGTNYNWAIAVQTSNNEIVSSNILASQSSSPNLGYVIYAISSDNCSYYNNTVTTFSSTGNYALYLHICNCTIVEGNNFQTETGIYIDAYSYSTRTNLNSLSNCTYGITDNGVNSLLLSANTLLTSTVFQDSFQRGNANAWTGTTSFNGGPWFVTSPTYSGDAYSMHIKYSNDGCYYMLPSVVQEVEYNFSVYWTANPASGQTFNFGFINNTFNQQPYEVLVNNTGSAIIWGVWVCSSTGQFHYCWNTSSSASHGNWYNICMIANASSSNAGAILYVNNTLTATAPTINGNFNQIAISYQDASPWPDAYIDNCTVQETTGTSGCSTNSVVLMLNCPSLGGSMSPSVATYTLFNATQETLTLTPNQYCSIIALNVDGLNVTLTNNQYTLPMQTDHFVYALFKQTSYPLTTYALTLTINEPQNTTYLGNIPVSFSTSGNDTSPTFSWNVLLANGSWLYPTNQTSQSATITTITDTESMTLYCEVSEANGTVAYSSVSFTVANGSAPNVYATPVAAVVVSGGIIGVSVAYFYRRNQKSRTQTAYTELDARYSLLNCWEFD